MTGRSVNRHKVRTGLLHTAVKTNRKKLNSQGNVTCSNTRGS